MIGTGNSQGMLCIIDHHKEQGGRLIKKRSRMHKIIHWSAIAGGIVLVMAVLLFVAVNTWPVLGANGADLLRGVIGNRAVAGLEMAYNQVQDRLLHLKYQIGLVKPAADWETSLTNTCHYDSCHIANRDNPIAWWHENSTQI